MHEVKITNVSDTSHKFSRGALLIIAAINFYFLISVRICDNNGTNWQTIIASDGKGYYEYLRAAFINHNLSKEDSTLGFIRMAGDEPVIKFFAGPAIAWSPFFFAAKAIASVIDNPTDGYTFEFQVMIAVAGFCYCLLGLFFTERLLRIFSVPDFVRAVTLLMITYGTNLFYYAVLEPSMSHIYAFACVSGFIFCSHRYFNMKQIKHLIFASVFLGLTILIRPTNGVVILMIPFLVQGREAFFSYNWKHAHLITSLLIISAFVFTQMLLWHVQTGNWLVWSYSGEGFYFTRPALSGVLFSYDKGWFVYTPLAFISMIGFVPLWKISRRAAVFIAVTLLAAIYFTAAWWCWNYANAFGMRPLIDFYALVSILLALFISSLKRQMPKILMAAMLAGVLSVSLIQTYQYYQNILQHYSMSKGKYWFVFLKMGDRYKNILGGNADLMPYAARSPVLIHQVNDSFEKQEKEFNEKNVVVDPANKENKCFRFDSLTPSLINTISADSSVQNAGMLYIRISLKRMEAKRYSSSAAKIITELRNEEIPAFHYQFLLNDFPDEDVMQWRTYHYAFWIRNQLSHSGKLTFEIQNGEKKIFFIDDLEIKVFRIFQH